jgi:hypothetical protein
MCLVAASMGISVLPASLQGLSYDFFRFAPQEGHTVHMEALSTLIPYRTEHINRFGNYVINPNQMAEPLEQHSSRGALPIRKVLLHPEQDFVNDNRRLALCLQLGQQVIKLRKFLPS